MKKALIVVVVLVAGLVIYNFATTGELSLIPSFSLSEEEQQVKDLENVLASARKQYTQALRSASLGGIDSTGDVESVRRSVNQVAKELKALRKRLKEPSAIERAERLSLSVADFSKELQ